MLSHYAFGSCFLSYLGGVLENYLILMCIFPRASLSTNHLSEYLARWGGPSEGKEQEIGGLLEEVGDLQAQFSTLPGVCPPLPPPAFRARSTLCPHIPLPLGYIMTRTLFPINLPGETQARKTGHMVLTWWSSI